MGSHCISWELRQNEGNGPTLRGVVACYSRLNAPCLQVDPDECAAVKSIKQMGAVSAWKGARRHSVADGVIDVRLSLYGEYAWKYAMENWHPDERWAE